MGLLIYLIFAILFIYGCYLVNKNKINESFEVVGFFLMTVQLLSVLGNIELQYSGYPIEEFSSKGWYYIGVIAYYIGYFMFSIIALLLVYIPILTNKKRIKDNKEILNDNQENTTDRVENYNPGLSMKYYNFFKKWYLPFVVIINFLIIISNLLNFEDMDLVVLLMINVILYVALPIKLVSVLEKKEKFGFFLLMSFFILDYIVKVIFGTINCFEADPENRFFIYVSTLIGTYGIWFVPNIIYFAKRRYLFINE